MLREKIDIGKYTYQTSSGYMAIDTNALLFNEVIIPWAKEAGVKTPIGIIKRNNSIEVYTSEPGRLIGKQGNLISKYNSIADHFGNGDNYKFKMVKLTYIGKIPN